MHSKSTNFCASSLQQGAPTAGHGRKGGTDDAGCKPLKIVFILRVAPAASLCHDNQTFWSSASCFSTLYIFRRNTEPDVCADKNIESRYAWLLAFMNLLRGAPFEKRPNASCSGDTVNCNSLPEKKVTGTSLALPNKQGAYSATFNQFTLWEKPQYGSPQMSCTALAWATDRCARACFSDC